MKLLPAVLILTFLTGCTSWGNRAIHIEGDYSDAGRVEGFVIDINSGADVKGFSGVIAVVSTKDKLDISVTGESKKSLASPAHEATVDGMKVGAKVVGEMTEGAVRGFAP